MKRVTKVIILLALVVLSTVIFTGCLGEGVYRLYFKVDGELYKRTFTDGISQVDLPENPAKKGHTFAGWYFDDETFQNRFEYDSFEENPIAEDTSLYARWIINDYLITFNSNGGSAVPSQTKLFGGRVSVPAEPTREGRIFEGWYTDNYSFNYAYDFETPVESNFHLYAKWTTVGYFDPTALFTITFVSNGGTDVLPIELTAGKIINPPRNPERLGSFKFEGWFLDDGTFEEAFSFGMMPSESIILYAKWQEHFTITFESNGGTPVEPITKAAGTLISEPVSPTKSGKAFDGWYVVDENFGPQTLFFFSSMPAENITLYALWHDGYTLTYESNGGTEVPPITKREDTRIYPPNPPTKDGYLFAGWYEDDGTFSQEFVFYKIPTVDKTVYAKWDEAFKITYISNGGTSILPTIKRPGEGISSPNPPTKKGFRFKGWYLDDESFLEYFEFTTMPSEDITLFAKWEEEIELEGGALEALWGEASDLFFEMWGDAFEISQDSEIVFVRESFGGAIPVIFMALEGEDDNGGAILAIECLPSDVNMLLSLINQDEDFGEFVVVEGYNIIAIDMIAFKEILLDKVEEEGDVYYNLDKTIIYRVNVSDEEFITPEGVIQINDYAFLGNDIEVLIIRESVTAIKNNALLGCEGIIIFSEAQEKPEGWEEYWNLDYEDDGIFKYHEVYFGFEINEERSYTFNAPDISHSETIDKMYLLDSDVPTTLERSEYRLMGWYDNLGFTGDMITFPYYDSENTQLYAFWEETFKITYSTNGGTPIPPTIDVAGALLTPPEPPTRDGYEFDDWYIDDGTFLEKFVFDFMPAQNTTIFANWVEKVLENLWNEVSSFFFEMWWDAIEIQSDDEIEIISKVIEGYEVKALMLRDETYFAIQCLSSDILALQALINQNEDITQGFGEFILLEGYDCILVLDVIGLEEIFLKSVISEGDGIYFSSDGKTILRINTDKEEFITPVEAGKINKYAFLNNRDTSVVIIRDSIIDIEERAFEGSTLIIFAEASEKPEGWAEYWNIKYDDGEGNLQYHEVYFGLEIDEGRLYSFHVTADSPEDEDSSTFNQMYVLSPPTLSIEREGQIYIAIGWYDNSLFSGERITFPYYDSEKTQLYGYWEEVFTITYNTNGGSLIYPTIDVAGALLTPPEAPTRDGFGFAGWYVDDWTFLQEFIFDTMPSEDITIYAKWLEDGDLEDLWNATSYLFFEMWEDAIGIQSEDEVEIIQTTIGGYEVKVLMLKNEIDIPIAIECHSLDAYGLLDSVSQNEEVSKGYGEYTLLKGYSNILVINIIALEDILLGNVKGEGGIYLSLDGKTILRINTAEEEFTTPEAEKINKYAFLNNRETRVVIIKSSVLYIEGGAFEGCSPLAIFAEALAKPEGWAEYWYLNYELEGNLIFHEFGFGFIIDEGRSYTFYAPEAEDPVHYETYYNQMYILFSQTPHIERNGHVLVGWRDGEDPSASMVSFPYYDSIKTQLYACWEERGFSPLSAIAMGEGFVHNVNITEADTFKYYSFTPNLNGYYIIESFGDENTTISVVEGSTNTRLAYHYEELGENFLILLPLYEGETYYFEVGIYPPIETGQFSIKVTYDDSELGELWFEKREMFEEIWEDLAFNSKYVMGEDFFSGHSQTLAELEVKRAVTLFETYLIVFEIEENQEALFDEIFAYFAGIEMPVSRKEGTNIFATILFSIDKIVFTNCYFENDSWLTEDGKHLITCKAEGEYYKLPDDVETIGMQAFDSLDLSVVYITEGVTLLSKETFIDCFLLERIIIPVTLDRIEEDSFAGCDALDKVFYMGTEIEFNAINCEDDTVNNATIYFYSDDEPGEPGNYWRLSHEPGDWILIWP